MAGTAATRRAHALPEIAGRVLSFSETGPDGFHRSWIMFFPVGKYEHPEYGDLDFSQAKLAHIKKLFDQRVRHIDVALDADHRAAHAEDSRATGWVEALELREAQPDGTPAGLWGRIKWTPYGMTFLKSDEYRYFSPEFGSWQDPQTGEKFDDVLLGGGLTNRPFLKVLPAIALSERTRQRQRQAAKVQVEAGGGMTVKKGATQGTALGDAERADLERELAILRLLAEGKGGKKKAPKRAKAEDDEDAEDEADGGDDEGAEGEDAEDEQMYGEGGEDEALDEGELDEGELDEGEAYDEADGDGADDEEDEDDEEPAPRKKRKLAETAEMEMTESGMSLAEQRRMARALAEANFKLYEMDNERTLSEWQKGHFVHYRQNGGKQAKERLAPIALTRGFMEHFRSFMRTEGVTLSEGRRTQVLALLEHALSNAVVDLSERGSAYDPDGKMTTRARRARVALSEDALQRAAEQIALAEHQSEDLMALDDATRLDIYTRAAAQVKY